MPVSAAMARPDPTLIVVEATGWRAELPRLIEDLSRAPADHVKVLVLTRHSAWLDYLQDRVAEHAAALVSKARTFTLAPLGSARDLLDRYHQASEIYARARHFGHGLDEL